jgi:AmmeMemoRadiSam system protein B
LETGKKLMSVYRQPAVAGLFYPAGYWKLKEQLQILLENSVPGKNFDNIVGLIVPHAGYIYSGRTAAYAYNLVKDKTINNVVIISPSHREYFPGVCIYEGDGYETPLGKVPVNREMTDELTRENKFVYKGVKGHGNEHAVEVHIPFLQYIIQNEFRIVPVVMGDQSGIFIDELAVRLSAVVDESTLIIASSDLSHFFNRKDADRLDSIVEKRINDFDYQGLQHDLEKRICEACGGGSIVALMQTAALINKKNSFVIHRSDSGDVTGDLEEVVGYLSAVIYGEK